MQTEKQLLAVRKYRQSHKEKCRKLCRKWRLNNKEKVKAYNKQAYFKRFGKAKTGICPICLRENVILHHDHDHKTNKFRGYICFKCNSFLGLAKDSIPNLQRAIDYLKENLSD